MTYCNLLEIECPHASSFFTAAKCYDTALIVFPSKLVNAVEGLELPDRQSQDLIVQLDAGSEQTMC